MLLDVGKRDEGALEMNLISPLVRQGRQGIPERTDMVFDFVQVTQVQVGHLLPELAVGSNRCTVSGEVWMV